ncbi:hypothetical protein ACFYKX_07930 [Cytobacillus sp. FJAT-54145]|uniref:Uncharacterized protein n=1 Tax=Cytobacillus spartinae TaxID=3299023 RepID=A0ABW6KAE8_9BACI
MTNCYLYINEYITPKIYSEYLLKKFIRELSCHNQSIYISYLHKNVLSKRTSTKDELGGKVSTRTGMDNGEGQMTNRKKNPKAYGHRKRKKRFSFRRYRNQFEVRYIGRESLNQFKIDFLSPPIKESVKYDIKDSTLIFEVKDSNALEPKEDVKESNFRPVFSVKPVQEKTVIPSKVESVGEYQEEEMQPINEEAQVNSADPLNIEGKVEFQEDRLIHHISEQSPDEPKDEWVESNDKNSIPDSLINWDHLTNVIQDKMTSSPNMLDFNFLEEISSGSLENQPEVVIEVDQVEDQSIEESSFELANTSIDYRVNHVREIPFLGRALTLGDKIKVFYGKELIDSGSFVTTGQDYFIWVDSDGSLRLQLISGGITIGKGRSKN